MTERMRGRAGLLVQVGSLLATAWIIWASAVRPHLRQTSLASLAGRALFYAALAFFWGAAITFVLYLTLPRRESQDMIGRTLRTASTAIWFAPATILLSQVSPAALIPALVVVVSATRLLYWEWEAARRPGEEFAIDRGLFGANLPETPRFTREFFTGLAASITLQFGAVAVLNDKPLLGGALLAMCAAILTLFALTSGAAAAHTPKSLPRSALGIVLTILLAAGLTIGGTRGRRGIWGWGFDSGDSSAQGPIESLRDVLRQVFYAEEPGKHGDTDAVLPPTPATTTNVGDGSFPGVILWPEVKTVTRLVAPAPHGIGQGARLAQTYSIPFGGEYWMYRQFYHRPPPNSYFRRGSPAELSFSTTDHWPLQMEAHQKLDEPIDLSCCRKVNLEIWNGDRFPGTVFLELLALDGERPWSLGVAPVESRPDLKRDPVIAVPETLEFTVPAGVTRCTEFEIVFRRGRTRMDKSAKIAVERFVLVL